MNGRVKEAAGALTGERKLKRQGQGDQAVGKMKQKVEKVGFLGTEGGQTGATPLGKFGAIMVRISGRFDSDGNQRSPTGIHSDEKEGHVKALSSAIVLGIGLLMVSGSPARAQLGDLGEAAKKGASEAVKQEIMKQAGLPTPVTPVATPAAETPAAAPGADTGAAPEDE